MDEAEWGLVASVHGHGSPDGGCAILFDLVDERIHADWDLDTPSDARILDHAPELLHWLVAGMLGGDRRVRIDLPHDANLPGSWPRSCADPAAVRSAVGSLLRFRDRALLYPIAIWSLPAARQREVEAAIREFRENRMDISYFDRILAAGGDRIAVFPTSITHTMSCDRFDAALARARATAAALDLSVTWLDD
jgi:hypothetical protein